MTAWLAAADLGSLLLACSAALTLLTLASLAVGFGLERAAWARGRRVFAVPIPRDQLRHEAIGTALFVVLFAPALAAALHTGALSFSEGWLAQALGFFVPMLSFQLLYYWLHRAMHTRSLFWMHRWHHVSRVTTPLTGFSMHPVETLGWIAGLLGPAVVLARFELLGAGGFTGFLAFLWFGNITGHANAEIFPYRVTWKSALSANAVVFHSLHHARYTGHYGFATALFDRLFRTEWPDWLPLHQKIVAGQALERLQERGDPADNHERGDPGRVDRGHPVG